MFNLSIIKAKLPLIVTVLILIVAVLGLSWFAWYKAMERDRLTNLKDELNVAWSIGPADAKVVVEMFEDFQCSHCKDFSKDVKPLLVSTFANQSVRFEFKHFPIFANSITLAEAAEAAGAQGKFWEYHDKMFENFGNLNSAKLDSIATELGLNMETFKKDTSSRKFRGDVNVDKEKANTYKIQGTPAIVVNGKLTQIKSDYFKDISSAINSELGITPVVETSSTTTTVGDL